ncbi:hypothetical protein, partial [Clostridium perfringens]
RGGLRTVSLAGDRMRLGTLEPGRPLTPGFAKAASASAGDGRAVFSADGRIAAAVVQDFEHAPAIYAGPVASLAQVTHDNDAVAPTVA